MENQIDEKPQIGVKEKTLVILEKTFKDGFGVVPFSILKNPKIPSYLKAVYILLLSYAWYDAECFPGQQRLGNELGLTIVAINRQLKELKKLGLLDWKRRGLGKTNIYYLLEIPDNLKSDLTSSINQDLYSNINKLYKGKVDKVIHNNNLKSASHISDISIKGKKKEYKKIEYKAEDKTHLLREYAEHRKDLSDNLREAIRYYDESYEDKLGDSHPKLKLKQWWEVERALMDFEAIYELGEEGWSRIMDEWFKKKEGTDFNIIHFSTGAIIENCARNAGLY